LALATCSNLLVPSPSFLGSTCIMGHSAAVIQWLASTVRILQNKVTHLEENLKAVPARVPPDERRPISLHAELFGETPTTEVEHGLRLPSYLPSLETGDRKTSGCSDASFQSCVSGRDASLPYEDESIIASFLGSLTGVELHHSEEDIVGVSPQVDTSAELHEVIVDAAVVQPCVTNPACPTRAGVTKEIDEEAKDGATPPVVLGSPSHLASKYNLATPPLDTKATGRQTRSTLEISSCTRPCVEICIHQTDFEEDLRSCRGAPNGKRRRELISAISTSCAAHTELPDGIGDRSGYEIRYLIAMSAVDTLQLMETEAVSAPAHTNALAGFLGDLTMRVILSPGLPAALHACRRERKQFDLSGIISTTTEYLAQFVEGLTQG